MTSFLTLKISVYSKLLKAHLKMAETNYTVPVLTEVLDHINNSKDVSSDTIKEMYDKWVPSYDEELRKNKYQSPSKASEILSEYFSEKNISILDCGAGTGLVGEELHRFGFTNIVALDLSPKSLAAAEQKGVYKKLICAEVGKGALPFDDNCFDAVTCAGCFLPTHIRPDGLRELVRIVKPGGIIVLLIGRRYIEVEKGHEKYFCKYYHLEFEEVTLDLERSKRWKVISKTSFPDMLETRSKLSFVWKVL